MGEQNFRSLCVRETYIYIYNHFHLPCFTKTSTLNKRHKSTVTRIRNCVSLEGIVLSPVSQIEQKHILWFYIYVKSKKIKQKFGVNLKSWRLNIYLELIWKNAYCYLACIKNHENGGIPWWSSVQGSTVSPLRAQVQSLVGELRSCNLCSMACKHIYMHA